MIDAQIFGMRSSAYHIENLSIHIINTLLLFLLSIA